MAEYKNNIGGILILDNNDTQGIHKIKVESISEDVINLTGFNPKEKLAFVQNGWSKEDLEKRGDVLKDAAELNNHIGATIKSNDAAKNELTLSERYQKLLNCIEEYNNADPLIQAAVGPRLNRAINSMNREHTDINVNREVTEAEVQFRQSLQDIHPRSLSAAQDLIDAFTTYKEMSTEEQQSVLPMLQHSYRSYMDINPDDPTMKQTVQEEYLSLRKTFQPNTTFDTESLQAPKDNALVQELSTIDGSKLSYKQLEEIVGYHVKSKEDIDSIYQNQKSYLDNALEAWRKDETNFQGVQDDLKKYFNIDMTPEIRSQLETWKATPDAPTPELILVGNIPKIEPYDSKNSMSFSGLSIENKSIAYNEYLRILEEYADAHPRSINAKNLSDHLKDEYFETVRSTHSLPMLDTIKDVKNLDASTPSWQREYAVYNINDVLDSYARLPEDDKVLYRGLIQEAVDNFNDYKLHNVIVPKSPMVDAELSSMNKASEFNAYINHYQSSDYTYQHEHFGEMVDNYKSYSSTRNIPSLNEQFENSISKVQSAINERYGEREDTAELLKQIKHDLDELPKSFEQLSYSEKLTAFANLQEFCEKYEIEGIKVVNNANVKFENALDTYFENAHMSKEQAVMLKNSIMYDAEYKSLEGYSHSNAIKANEFVRFDATFTSDITSIRAQLGQDEILNSNAAAASAYITSRYFINEDGSERSIESLSFNEKVNCMQEITKLSSVYDLPQFNNSELVGNAKQHLEDYENFNSNFNNSMGYLSHCGMNSEDVAIVQQVLTNPTPPRVQDDYGTNEYLQEVLNIVQEHEVDTRGFFESEIAKRYGIENMEDLHSRMNEMNYIERLQCTQALTNCCAEPAVVTEINNISYTTGMQKEIVTEVSKQIEEQESVDIDPAVQKMLQEKAMKEIEQQFAEESDALKKAIELRSSIMHSNGLDGDNKSFAHAFEKFNRADNLVQSYVATALAAKTEGFYLSGEQHSELMYTGFHDSKQITMKVEEIVGPNCFIGRTTDSNESMLIMTPQPLDFGITKEDRDIYSKLTGVPSFDLSPEIDARMSFGVEDGKLMVTLAIPNNKLGETTEVASQHIGHDSEVLKITPSGTGSILLIKNPETQELTEVKTTWSEEKIMNQAIVDVRFNSYSQEAYLNQSEYALQQNFDVTLQNNKSYAADAMISIYKANDEQWNSIEHNSIDKLDQYEFYKQNHDLLVNINNKTYEVYAYKEIEVDDQKRFSAIIKNEDGTFTQITDERSANDIKQTLFSQECSERILTDNDTIKGITNYFGRTTISIKEGDDMHFYPIIDMDSKDGHARVFYVDEKDGQRHFVTLEQSYSEAQIQFAKSQAKMECRDSQEYAESSSLKVNGEIYYSYTNKDGLSYEGMLVNAGKNGCLINVEDKGLVFVHDSTVCEKLVNMNGISTIRTTEEGYDLVYGTGNEHKPILYEHTISNAPVVADIVHPENSSEFIRDSFSTDSKGNNVFTTRHVSDTNVENEEIIYLHAQRANDNKTINVFIVAQSGDNITGYQLDNVELKDFRLMSQYAKISEVANEDELKALHKLNAGNANIDDVNKVIDAFNKVKSDTTHVDNIKHVPEPGDISQAKLINKDGQYTLKGIDHEGNSITIQNPLMKMEGGEMYIYSSSEEGMKRNRIISTAFGNFAKFEEINAKKMEWARVVDESHIYQNVNVEHTTISHFDSKTTNINELFERKFGMSCSSELGKPIPADHLSIAGSYDPFHHKDIKVSMDYGVIIKETAHGPNFIYYDPDSNSNLNKIVTMNANKSLSLDEIPINAQDAKDKKFVLVDYDNGVAIREGGLCYTINESTKRQFIDKLNADKLEHPHNFYDEKIAQPQAVLLNHSTFVSQEKFEGSSVDIRPIVDNWSIYNSKGKFMLAFNDMCMDERTSTIGKDFEITKLHTGDDGIYATIAMPMKHGDNTTSRVFEVRLGMPTEEQMKTMEAATKDLPLITARQKVDAYCEQITLQNGKDMYQHNHIELHRGDFVSVQDEKSQLGVLYKVIDNQGNLMIVGNTDNETVHPSFLSTNQLEHRAISKLELPEDTVSRVRFAEKIIYTESQVLDDGRARVTMGDRDLATNHVNGISDVCEHTESYRVDKEDVHEHENVEKDDVELDR